jgi:prevent-host-death family protein
MINLAKDIRPISYLKLHAAEILKQVEERNNPVVITQNGAAKAVLMDINHYQNIIDSINLLKILSIGENDIKNNNIISQEELDKEIGTILV